jgi:hypothetical protein
MLAAYVYSSFASFNKTQHISNESLQTHETFPALAATYSESMKAGRREPSKPQHTTLPLIVQAMCCQLSTVQASAQAAIVIYRVSLRVKL